jgi:2-polyprenyl-3-methyl-5-hydroxy-6-metoxy-1,4-benzoquinol methylase
MQTTATTATTSNHSADADEGNGWREAGAAWGHAAQDWAYLFEPYARDAAEHIFDEVDLREGTELFDMACGSGYATARAARRGARTTGLDASEALIDIARRRDPKGAWTLDVYVRAAHDHHKWIVGLEIASRFGRGLLRSAGQR